jgi:glycosyl transferase family 9 (putative heptosyltransferase)
MSASAGGENQHVASELAHQPVASVGFVNGFGRTLGDSIIGLQALSIAIRIGAIPARPTLFRLPQLPLMVQEIYKIAGFAQLRTLPPEFSRRDRRFDPGPSVDRVIDLRDFAYDPEFQRSSMIDFFLKRVRVAPDSISTLDKRNAWLSPCITHSRQFLTPGYILVCPKSSMRLRDMPIAVHRRILQIALATGPVVTQGQLPDDLVGRAIYAPPCKTIEELCDLVRNARLVISTDTAMVHIADAFDVTCLAFFPTHSPEWRVRDYPHCRAIQLRSTLPLGLEFARSPHDEQLAHEAWFHGGDDLSWLTRVLTEMLEKHSHSRG